MSYDITQVSPLIDSHEINSVLKVVESGWLTEGVFTERFIDEIKIKTGSKFAVLAPNGTLGLYLALLALDLPKGGEILIPDFTFYASATSAIFAGLTPVFVDVDYSTCNISVELIEERITKKTVAIMPVHVYGQTADMDPIKKIAEKYNLRIIEDAAQAMGVTYNKMHAGCIGDIGVISFFADKTITMGEGAVILTQNEDLYRNLKLLRNQGRLNSGSFKHESLGMNFRVTDIQSALGFEQLKKLDEIIKNKLSLYEYYMSNLKDVPNLKFNKVIPESSYVPFRFFLKSEHSKKIMESLENSAVQPRGFFYPMHRQPMLKKYSTNGQVYPNSDRLYNEGVCLPIHSEIDRSKIDSISKIVSSCVLKGMS